MASFGGMDLCPTVLSAFTFVVISNTQEKPTLTEQASIEYREDAVFEHDEDDATEAQTIQHHPAPSIETEIDGNNAMETQLLKHNLAPLEKVPAEMLLFIIDFLPPSSAPLLSLTSQTLLKKLGNKYLRQINKERPAKIKKFPHGTLRPLTLNNKEYETFMQLLDKDLPNSIYCFYCKLLHPPSKTKQGYFPGPEWKELPCSRVNRYQRAYQHNLTFSAVQFTMKRHRLGLDTSSQLEAMRSSNHSYNELTNKYKWHASTEPRIRDGKLLLRATHTLEVPIKEGRPKFPKRVWEFELCPHLRSDPEQLWNDDATWEDANILDCYLQCKVGHHFARNTILGYEPKSIYDSDGSDEVDWLVGPTPEEHCKNCGEMDGCGRCETEFQYIGSGVKKEEGFDKRWFWVKVVTWQDFGNGETPSDWAWSEHTKPFRVAQTMSIEVGSIKKTFEGQ
ncbi:hypothetical protein N431DRAFT_470692 [Stipitochalara longipes BDJ]|nr:hypothetical protein N431DRAFT_470692 [Stipitochalara longipes BDJ]